MRGALERTVAAVFVRRGSPTVTVSDFKNDLSMNLKWFKPSEARRVLVHAADVGLVAVDGDTVTARFDAKKVSVPVDFRPSLAVLEERPEVAAAAPPESASDGSAPAPDASTEEDAPDDAPPMSLVERVLREAAHTAMEDLADVRRAFEEERARRAGVFDEAVCALIVARRRGVDVRALAEDAASTTAQAPDTQT